MSLSAEERRLKSEANRLKSQQLRAERERQTASQGFPIGVSKPPQPVAAVPSTSSTAPRPAPSSAGPTWNRPPAVAPLVVKPVEAFFQPRSKSIQLSQNDGVPKKLPEVHVKMEVCSSTHILFSYNDAVIRALKSVASAFFDHGLRAWKALMTDVEAVERALKSAQGVAVVFDEKLSPEVIRLLMPLPPATDGDFAGIETTLKDILFPYQRRGVLFGIEKGGRLLLADEMGLGKSVQALAIARAYRKEWPLVIICPASVKATWKETLEVFLPDVTNIFMIETSSDPMPQYHNAETAVIMSYDQMSRKLADLETLHPQVIIFDESHQLKERKAKRTQTATQLALKAKRVILLSGTPALSRPSELYPQINLVNSKLFPSFYKFAERYCDGKQDAFGYKADGATHTEELSAILQARVMIRRLKSEVLGDLPKKTREVIYLSGDQIDYQMKSLKDAKAAFNAANGKFGPKDERAMEYYHQTGIVKAGAVVDYIVSTFFSDATEQRKVLVFAHHTVVLDSIVIKLNQRRVQNIRIDGSTPPKDRGELCRRFQHDPNVQVAVLGLKAAGVGINLTAANVVVFAELDWTPATLAQAEDRAHRIGNEQEVHVQYLVARNTADDMIFPMIQNKLNILGQVNLSSDSFEGVQRTNRNMDSNGIARFLTKDEEPVSKKPRLP